MKQSAILLKRLAEAAAGYPTGNDIWIVAGLGFPHSADVFESEDSAKQFLLKQVGKEHQYGVFGPYLTERPAYTFDQKVVHMTVTLEDSNGVQTEESVDVKNTDVVFIRPTAVEKFLIPYYCNLYGAKEAGKIWESYTTGGAEICGHTDATRWLPKSQMF